MALAKAEILDAISGMTVLELAGLIKDMEEKFGVSAAAAAVAVAAPAAGGAPGAAAGGAEQTEFTVHLTNAGASGSNSAIDANRASQPDSFAGGKNSKLAVQRSRARMSAMCMGTV